MRNARHVLQRLNDRVPAVHPQQLVRCEHELIRAWPWPGGPANPPQLEGYSPACNELAARLVLTLRAMHRCSGIEVDDNAPMQRPTEWVEPIEGEP